MRLEREHTLEAEIKASSFVSVSHAESSTNEENFHVFQRSRGESISKYQPETFEASKLNYSDNVVLNALQN